MACVLMGDIRFEGPLCVKYIHSAMVCWCYSVCSSCSPTSTDKIYTTTFLLHQQIYNLASAKFRLKIGPAMISSWLLEVHAC